MSAWEREHPDALQEAEVSDTNFFGFAGQGKMSGFFDYVLVTADLRASEETQDSSERSSARSSNEPLTVRRPTRNWSS